MNADTESFRLHFGFCCGFTLHAGLMTTQRKGNILLVGLTFHQSATSTKQGLCAELALQFRWISHGQNTEKCVTKWQ